MRYFFFIFIFLTSSPAALFQSESSRLIDAAGVKELVILTDEVYKIYIRSGDGEQILLTTYSEGEYYNEIHLDVERSQERVVLNSRFREILQGGFDKLSAHKVFSMEISLQVPQGLDVYVRSNIASVTASGNFRNFKAELQEGYCHLEQFTGNALVNTYRGNIWVQTAGVEVKANSVAGKVQVDPNLQGQNRIQLRSVTGDIKVEKN
ncbi:hypothetical protein FHG64_08900 [Antarcticibacterium flavum]|uniref:DUF4097 domain-containing protein n=1 Tax=Antarcticibacterium flavum TaxID=2058175 RepID=A0A5B7X468_9FLAO|nr:MULTISPECIES: hypothetical protein [Antarcticibacterium]MCM4159096.1 hypothetical protein [Antarcticibacterium sp. W02-3]QCY69498.1 hypothetical protein FHG64_08900 [Antarcticibacterium flavum]